MEVTVQTESQAGTGPPPPWRSPLVWLREQRLGRQYWIFFTTAFFFDAGFSVYYFLFNLYLLDFHLNERTMGWIGGAMTLGSLVGTLPSGELTRRFGVRPLLIVCLACAPMLGVARVVWMQQPVQIGLAFLTGLAMCNWGVCFLPTVARLTTEKNRNSGFSLIFSVSIGTSALGGLVCGYLPSWLRVAGYGMQAAEVKRMILVSSCAIAALALIPALWLRVPRPRADEEEIAKPSFGRWLRAWKPSIFLLRYLPCMALWSAVLAAFTPFANVYLARNLHMSMGRIGLIFSTAQLVQLGVGLVTPLALRVFGLMNGIVAMQMAAGLMLAALASSRNEHLAVFLYLGFAAAQWMSSPGLYNLLMSETPDHERSSAAAMTMFSNALVSSGATALAGALFARHGYPPVLMGIAVVALAVAMLFQFLVAPLVRSVKARVYSVTN